MKWTFCGSLLKVMPSLFHSFVPRYTNPCRTASVQQLKVIWLVTKKSGTKWTVGVCGTQTRTLLSLEKRRRTSIAGITLKYVRSQPFFHTGGICWVGPCLRVWAWNRVGALRCVCVCTKTDAHLTRVTVGGLIPSFCAYVFNFLHVTAFIGRPPMNSCPLIQICLNFL